MYSIEVQLIILITMTYSQWLITDFLGYLGEWEEEIAWVPSLSQEERQKLWSLELYFSRQRHWGGSNENPTAYQVPYNAATLVQQHSMYNNLKFMNMEVDQQDNRLHKASQALNICPRNHYKHVTIQARYKNINFTYCVG